MPLPVISTLGLIFTLGFGSRQASSQLPFLPDCRYWPVALTPRRAVFAPKFQTCFWRWRKRLRGWGERGVRVVKWRKRVYNWQCQSVLYTHHATPFSSPADKAHNLASLQSDNETFLLIQKWSGSLFQAPGHRVVGAEFCRQLQGAIMF